MLLLLSVGTALLSAHESSAPTSGAWSVDIVGTLNGDATCSNGTSVGHHDACESRVPNLPMKFRTEKVDLLVVNESSKRTCYGVSISSTYLAGLNSFCVGGYERHHYRVSGPAAHFRDLNLILFVTSASSNVPIGPIPDTAATGFQIIVTGTDR